MKRAHRTLLTTCALIAALAGCRVGPNYHAPALPKNADAPLVSVDPTVETTVAPPDAWWRLYSDDRLDELVQQALRANRDLAAADANLNAAREVLTAAHASRYPSTNVVAGGVYGRDAVTEEILELADQRPQSIWLFEDVLQVSYEVDLFGRVHRAIEVANANADAVVAARDSVRVIVAAEVTRAYAAVCALGEEVNVAHHSLEVVSHEADITAKRYDAGASTPYDVKRAQALVAQVRASIPTLEGERRAALFGLTALLGRTPADAPHDIEACVVPPRLSALIPVGDGAALIRRRPDVRQAERRLAAATAQIGVATADLYPTVKLVGLYGGAATQVSELATNLGLTWGIGPTISWNFLNQAAARAKVRQAKLPRPRPWRRSIRWCSRRSKRPSRRSSRTAPRSITVSRLRRRRIRFTAHSTSRTTSTWPARSAISTCSRPSSPWSHSMPRSPPRTPHSSRIRSPSSRPWAAAGAASSAHITRRLATSAGVTREVFPPKCSIT
jgi:NodT family efflux transporter outer membrane factor (OMF) lipoprotein